MRFGLAILCAVGTLTPVTALGAVIGYMTPAQPLTVARIAQLPKAQQQAWRTYLDRSVRLMAADKAALVAERGNLPVPPPPPTGHSGGSLPLDRPAAWYATPEARHVADTIVSFQTPAGGWGKNMDRSGPVRLRGQNYVPVEKLPANAMEPGQTADANTWYYVGTIDNNATTTEMRFLALVQAQMSGKDGNGYRAVFERGLRYLLEAQYPNGGWPQVYPLQGSYHDALTFNDDAVANVVTLLSAAATRDGDYAFVSPVLAKSAHDACRRAIDVILATQVMENGKPSVWGQQHDALTLTPVGARNFEPAALSADESAHLLLFLIRQPSPSPRMVAAITDGIDWLKAHAILGYDWPSRAPDAQGRRLVAKPGSGPIWSRYYDLRTGKPIFGDRDKSIHDDVNELSLERRNGYSWYNTAPARAIVEFDRWRSGLAR